MEQPAVMALSAEPCWERWVCPVQGGKEERLELEHVWWDVGAVQVGCWDVLRNAQEWVSPHLSRTDLRAQTAVSYIKYRLHTL